MKLAVTLVASVLGMEGHGHLDPKGIHLGGGAFDPGTSDGLALWAIRKCKKKVCAVWPFAKCPLNDITELSRSDRATRGPCCHKCWNKCPPYLARHRTADQTVFSNSETRRYLKDEVWEFLQEDIECETTRLKEEFLSVEKVGADIDMVIGDQSGFEGAVILSEPDTDGMLMDFAPVEEAEEAEEEGGVDDRTVNEACEDKTGWYQCHGHRHAHCCRDGCLNNPDRTTGICGADKCACFGKCDYRDRIEWTITEGRKLGCRN